MHRSSQLMVLFLAIGAALSLLVLPCAAAEKDWQQLLNGKDLTGWQDDAGKAPNANWVVEDGAIVRKPGAGMIWTKDRFGDFILEMEFKTEGNSGIFFRTDKPADCVQTGIEVQVYTPAKASKHSCGAVYDALAPTKDMVKPNAWNRVAVTARDSLLVIELNGEKIIDMDLNKWADAGKNPDGTANKFRAALKDFKREGHIGLQDHGANVWYRNIRIKPLTRGK